MENETKKEISRASQDAGTLWLQRINTLAAQCKEVDSVGMWMCTRLVLKGRDRVNRGLNGQRKEWRRPWSRKATMCDGIKGVNGIEPESKG